jgi:Maltokinase N-terminal cap domain
MSIIHKTTLTPTKLDLLTAWLPTQQWYRTVGHKPELTKAGGFRLDDPAGEVGIEFMVVGDDAAAVFYQVPMTYRGEPLAGADDALIGTAEHGVLGRRWVYDGVRDPVLVAQLVACIQGDAQPQAQSISDTPDPTVTVRPVPGVRLTAGFEVAANGPAGTDLRGEGLTLRVARVLGPCLEGHPCLSAPWRLPDGAQARGVFVSALT